MEQLINILQKTTSKLWIFVILACSMISCNSTSDIEREGSNVDCNVLFKYDYNMKYKDDFAHEVKRVALYIFDQKGILVDQKIEEGDMLAEGGYSMHIEIEPGKYHFIAWAGLTDETYAIPLLIPGVSDINELSVKTNRSVQNHNIKGETIHVVNKKMASLWHGETTQIITSEKNEEIIVSLVKDTHTFRIALEQDKAQLLNADMFEISIIDDNGWLNYDNSLKGDKMLTYQPYLSSQGSVTHADDVNPISIVVAEITVGRLIAEKNPRLLITNKEKNQTVLSIPLVNCLQLVEQEGLDISVQEYLDRQDEYSMTFFLDQNNTWLDDKMVINDWTVYPSQL